MTEHLFAWHCTPSHPIDVAHAALCDVGRDDLAEAITWIPEGDEHPSAGYIEVDHVILDEDDWNLINTAEAIARAYIGLPPLDHPFE